MRKKILCFILTLFFLFFCINNVFASNTSLDINTDKLNTNSEACILMDTKSDKILYAKNAYEKMYPASTTKLMTAILTLENCKLTDTAIVSHNAIFSIPVGYSHANLQEGEELTIEQLLNVLLIPSANDAAIVLAEHISGSVEKFTDLMNQKAKELGCKNTHFVNPNGIHNKDHYSTAYDLALIGKYAMKFSDIKRIAMVRQYTLPVTNKYSKTDRIFNATNALINPGSKYYYEYTTGLKTGYTDYAGSCIVSTAKKGNMELIEVVLKANSIAERYADCKAMFNYGFDNYTYKKLQTSGNIIKTVEISNATNETKNLEISVKDDISVLISSKTSTENLNPSIELNENLEAPIAENSVVGKVTYTIDGKTYSSDLIAENSVTPSNFEVIVFRILLIFLILYILYKLLKSTSNKKPKRRKHDKIKEYNVKSNKKRKHKSRKFKILNEDINTIHNGSGEIKFTQISDYLE